MNTKAFKTLSVAAVITVLAAGVSPTAAQAESRPAGGGGGGDIVVFDIIDSVSKDASRPAGGGGQDIVVFDVIDASIYI